MTKPDDPMPGAPHSGPTVSVNASALAARNGVTGLTAEEAAARLRSDGPNVLPANQPKPLWAIALRVLIEPMFVMLLVAGGLYLALGDRAEASFLLSFVLVIITITLVEERKTQRALEALRDLSAPLATVIRDRRETRIPSAEVVVGDLLSLREGDRIAADGVVVEGHVEVDESLLTGESVPVGKTVRNHEAEQLFAGTVVTKGRCLAQVSGTASATAIGKIGHALVSTVEAKSKLQSAARVLIRRFATLALVISASLFLLNWLWDGHDVLTSLLAGIALAMSILPEEIPVILTVFLALGAWRIARHKVLTRRVSAVETLGSITVLAVDKTGTLTQNRMRVAELHTLEESFRDDGTPLAPSFTALVDTAMLATPEDSFDPMERAIRQFSAPWREEADETALNRFPQKEYAIDPHLLVMSRAFATAVDHRYRVAAKGAPEAVLSLCHLSRTEHEHIQQQVEDMAERGLRVIAVAESFWEGEQWPASQHSFAYRFLGLIGLIDPPRPEVAEAVAECRTAGIRLIMLTGDHPVTALAIARAIGLDDRPQVLTGADIDQLDDAGLGERLRHTTVCARVQPVQKLRLVHVLQQLGEVVGMTGDGVNDAPALKAADVGVAMGQRGTDVAREAAALVLLDDNFASLVRAIRQGRRIYDNISKATRFTVAVHVPITALALVPSLLHWPILLMPVQIVLLELLIDPACSIIFEAVPESASIMRRPPRPVDETPFHLPNLWRGALQGFGLALILLLGDTLVLQMGETPQLGRSAVFTALLVGVFLLTLSNCNLSRPLWTALSRHNPWLLVMLAGVMGMLALMMLVPPLRALLGMERPSIPIVLYTVSMLALSLLWLELVRLLVRRGAPGEGEHP